MLSYNVADLLRSAPGTSERFDVAVAALPIADGVELADPVTGEVRLIYSGRSIIVEGHFQTALTQQCSRCLRPAKARVSVDVKEEALPSVELEGASSVDEEAEPGALRLSEYHELDLGPAVRDAISLAEPIAPLCRPDCPGLCETCGLDMVDNPGHVHANDEIDPRLAALVGIRDRLQ
jgi:uncharacterized protein